MHEMRGKAPLKCGCVLLAACSLSACTTNQSGSVTSAAVSPLADLNLVNTKIPEVLLRIQKQPYAMPVGRHCVELQAQIRALNEVLGPDLDAAATAGPGLTERAGDMVSDRAAGTVRATTESLIPFRSWVRKLSGAERHSRQVESALRAGTARRAFLKGMLAMTPCEPASSDDAPVATQAPPVEQPPAEQPASIDAGVNQ